MGGRHLYLLVLAAAGAFALYTLAALGAAMYQGVIVPLLRALTGAA